MQALVLRDLEASDVESLVAIAIAAWAPIYAYYRQALGEELFAEVFPDWQADKAQQIRAACAPGSQAHVCVAERANEIVGFVTFYVHPSRGLGEIGNNAVHPAHQGQGVATRMYAQVLERMKALGVRVVKVETGGDPAHAPARRAYEKVGFNAALPGMSYFRKL